MRLLKGIIRGHIINNKYNQGMYMTFFNFVRFGVVVMFSNNSTDVDISLSIWKLGTHIHFTLNKENLCRDVENHKNR